jgi:ABC-2 type transport system permease protein
LKPRLFWHVFSIEARKLMSYRVDFWINTLVGSIAQFVLVYCLWAAIMVEPGATRQGYTFDGLVLYYALVILLGKLVGTTHNQSDVSADVYDGGLSRYLLYPTSYFGFKYAQRLGGMIPAVVQVFVLGLAYLLILPFPEGIDITPASVAMGLVSLGIANLLFYSAIWLVQLVAFWADNVWSLVVMLLFVSRLLGGGMLPLRMFPEWIQGWLTALPFKYFYGFPVETLMGAVSGGAWLQGAVIGLVWCGVFAALSRVVWRRGMLGYTGVGI